MAHQKTKTAFGPNEEIRQELANAIESRKWDEMAAFQRDSDKLLNATLDMDGASVALKQHYGKLRPKNTRNRSETILAAFC